MRNYWLRIALGALATRVAGRVVAREPAAPSRIDEHHECLGSSHVGGEPLAHRQRDVHREQIREGPDADHPVNRQVVSEMLDYSVPSATALSIRVLCSPGSGELL